jgi:hypothetical protein
VYAAVSTARITHRVEAIMSNSTTESSKNEAIIDEVEVTSDTLTGRGGLSLFVRYLRGIGLYGQLETFFGSMRKSRKAQAIAEVFKQLFCFFLDGTSRHLVYFDSLRDDEGYARAMETEPGAMLSSHAVKRFFRGFWWPRIYLFRHLLQRLFLWRLRTEKPELVMLAVDTMVMDNDEALKRHGVRPTYKKVKGFQPLQMTWGPLCDRRGVSQRRCALESLGHRGEDGAPCRREDSQALSLGCAHCDSPRQWFLRPEALRGL